MGSTATSSRIIPVATSGTSLLYVDFLLTGIVMTFLGPLLPLLSVRWGLSDERAGYLIFAQFFSSMFGMLLSGTLVQRIGYRLTLMMGAVFMGAGMVLLISGPFLMGIVSVCVLGVGYGITSPAGNLRTAEANPERSASALNVINAVWGIGAMSSPFLLAAAQHAHGTDLFLYGTAAALLMLIVALGLARFVPDTHAEITQTGSAAPRLWTLRMLPVVSLVFFVYVGTETSFGNWVAMYARRLGTGNQTLATMTPSFFWGSLLAGRMLAPLVLKSHRSTSVATAALIFSLAGGVVLVSAHSVTMIAAGAVLAGLGLASIFPISVSLLPSWFGESARRASGTVFGSGNVGGAVLPWVVGAASTRYGNLRAGFFVPLVGVAFLLTFYLLNGKRWDGSRSVTKTPR
jgi:FHS family glucose/mannose:H+ symporter-like MFS transporter